MKKWIYAAVASAALALGISALQPTEAPVADQACVTDSGCCPDGPCCPGACCD